MAIVEESDATASIELSTPGGVTLTLTDEGGGKVEIVCGSNRLTMDSSGFSVRAGSKFNLNAPKADISAGIVNVDAGMAKFSGVVKCTTLLANTVVGNAYTPGAGNIW
jgi:hypothetical protein